MLDNKLRVALIVIDAVTASTAVGGGIALAAGLEGDRYPIEQLNGTPFHSYRIPGLMLATLVGGSATIATATTLRRSNMAAPASMIAGLALMGWIVGEVRLLKQPLSPERLWEAGYFAAGLTMAALGLQLERSDQR